MTNEIVDVTNDIADVDVTDEIPDADDVTNEIPDVDVTE